MPTCLVGVDSSHAQRMVYVCSLIQLIYLFLLLLILIILLTRILMRLYYFQCPDDRVSCFFFMFVPYIEKNLIFNYLIIFFFIYLLLFFFFFLSINFFFKPFYVFILF